MANKIVQHEFNGNPIRQRVSDDYVSLTDMAKVEGKLIADYLRLESTKAYIQALSDETGIPIVSLIVTKGGRGGGTFAHPHLAAHAGQWAARKTTRTMTGCIYVFRDANNKGLKIGFTTNLKSRTKSHKSSNPFLELVQVIDNVTLSHETAVHESLRKYRIPGTSEWYKDQPVVIRTLDLICSLPEFMDAKVLAN